MSQRPYLCVIDEQLIATLVEKLLRRLIEQLVQRNKIVAPNCIAQFTEAFEVSPRCENRRTSRINSVSLHICGDSFFEPHGQLLAKHRLRILMPSFVRKNCQRVGGTNVIQNRHGFRCISPAPESQICPRVIAEAIHSERRPFLACSKDEGFQSARWIGQCAECACVLRQRALGEDRQKSAQVAISNCGTQSEVVGDDLVTISCRALPRFHLSDR